MKISFPSRNDRCVGTRARVRSSPSRRRLARASRSRARAIDDDVILPSFPSPFSPSVPSRDSSRPVPTLHRHLDTVPRSVGRAGDADAISRRRRKAPAGVVVARAVRTERRRRRRERTARRTSTRDSHRASPAPSRSRAARRPRASFPHPNVIHPRARARGNDARDIHSTRRPSSVVRRRRDASREREEKNGRSARTSLAELARSLVRSRARDDVARNDRARRRVSSTSKSAGPVASLHFFIRARGYRVEACVKSMYVCEWFDTVKKRKKRCRRPVYVQ
jgi:hypothetical protein